LKLNYTHQLLIYADDVNFFGRGERKHAIKKNTEAVLAASKAATPASGPQ